MNIREIFDSPAVRSIEREIIDIAINEKHVPHESFGNNEKAAFAIRHLLNVRKRILDGMFVMTPEYKQLLSEFNEALTEKLKDMRNRVLQLRESCPSKEMDYKGAVFLNWNYPGNHPVQTMRAKAIWAILTDTEGENIQHMYGENGAHSIMVRGEEEAPTEHYCLFLDGKPDNWNERLDREMTKDMHLCYTFHNLYDHNLFSIFDLLWVRDFYIEISSESYDCIGVADPDDITIDWRKARFVRRCTRSSESEILFLGR